MRITMKKRKNISTRLTEEQHEMLDKLCFKLIKNKQFVIGMAIEKAFEIMKESEVELNQKLEEKKEENFKDMLAKTLKQIKDIEDKVNLNTTNLEKLSINISKENRDYLKEHSKLKARVEVIENKNSQSLARVLGIGK